MNTTLGTWWLVMAGGALGSAGRFALGQWLTQQASGGFPWATWCANASGSLGAGLVLCYLQRHPENAAYWRAFVMVGLLGGFTTYSTLMVECLLLSPANKSMLLFYLASTLLGGLFLVWLGAQLGSLFWPAVGAR